MAKFLNTNGIMNVGEMKALLNNTQVKVCFLNNLIQINNLSFLIRFALFWLSEKRLVKKNRRDGSQ